MTSLLTIFLVIGLAGFCWMMGKSNKSDNLFWILLISLLAGMAGGAIFNKISKETCKENITNFEQVYNPTQVSQATSIGFYTAPGETFALAAKPVGQDIETPAFGIKVSVAPGSVYGEIRGQPFKTEKGRLKSILFDTS